MCSAAVSTNADSDASAPGCKDATATMRSPKRSSGTPTTRQSYTAGCAFTASSTSSGNTFSPPVLMQLEPRPRRISEPSAATLAQSPGREWATPSMTLNVRADLSGSLKYPRDALTAATMPISSEPGWTTRPSSVTTFTDGVLVNLAVTPMPARVLTVAPIEPSVEPRAS